MNPVEVITVIQVTAQHKYYNDAKKIERVYRKDEIGWTTTDIKVPVMTVPEWEQWLKQQGN